MEIGSLRVGKELLGAVAGARALRPQLRVPRFFLRTWNLFTLEWPIIEELKWQVSQFLSVPVVRVY